MTRSINLKVVAKVFGVLAACGGVLLAYSYFIETRRLVVNDYRVAVKGWSQGMSGLRIAAISDIHGGSNGVDEAKLRQIVSMTNEQSPDVIVLLGDYVSQTVGRDEKGRRRLRMPITQIAEGLRGFKSKYGVFVVVGNHDDWYDNREVVDAFTNVGYTVLDGSVTTIPIGQERLRIIGLKDHLTIREWRKFSADAKALLDPTAGSGNVLILEHGPDVLPMITGDLSITQDPVLMLSGHTHGGQIRLPILGRPIVPSSYGQKYAAGHIRDNGLDLFVTTGIGTSLLPFRFMVTPEIAMVTVVAD